MKTYSRPSFLLLKLIWITGIPGSFKGTTKLVVQAQRTLSAGPVAAIVIVAVLLLITITAIIYLILIRRHGSPVMRGVYIETAGPAIEVARTSVTTRREDVVYSDVKIKPSMAPLISDKHTDTEMNVDDVMYSEVVFLH
ncbi:uncharacterized protein KZ484_025100 isoform 2-T2 [Pholidichthys leucotaenia]